MYTVYNSMIDDIFSIINIFFKCVTTKQQKQAFFHNVSLQTTTNVFNLSFFIHSELIHIKFYVSDVCFCDFRVNLARMERMDQR